MSNMAITVIYYILVIAFNLGFLTTGITIEPSTFIQGQSASITCSDPRFVRIRKSKNSIITCTSSSKTPDCPLATCFIDKQTCFELFFTQYYSYSKNGNNVTVNIGNVSKERDDGTWTCLESNGNIIDTTIDVKVPVQSVIIKQKNNLIFINGRRTSINCTTGFSYPPANITWSIGGTNINGATTTNNPDGTTTSILQYTPVKTDHNKILQCSATNGYGTTKSDSITLNIRYPPVVHINPSNSPYKVIKGKQLNLTCIVDEANPSPDQSTGFTWSKDGVTIPGQRSSVYRVESVERSHTGSYTCTGDNGVGTGTSTPVQVDVLFPPIVSTPSVYKVVELTDISLQCTATANHGDITYRWTGPGNLNTTGPWLNISNISKDRSGNYTCTATNLMVPTSSSSETGRGQNTTDIDVLFGPIVTLSPTTSSIKIQENTNLLLTCTVQSNPLPTSIKWYKPDETSENLSSDGQLVITSIKRNQAGLYICEANMTLEPSNGGPISRSDSKTVNIIIQYLDEVTINRKRLEVSEDEEVNITCFTDSNPVATITWYNGTRSISTVPSNTHSLIIDRATCLDTGVYTCQAINPEIPQLQFNQSAMLFVKCSPRHDPRVDRISTVSGDIGDVVQLVADVLVYPAPSFTWYYINTTTEGVIPIFNDGSYQQNVINTSINTFRSTLTINITSYIFYRPYSVNITNDVGSTDLMFKVQSQSVPDPPTNITYSQVGSHSICVDWRAGFNGGGQQKFIVQHSTDDKRWTESTPISSSSYCIENLQPDTLYYIRVVARNRYGDSQPVYLRSLKGDVSQISTEKEGGPAFNYGLIGGIVGGLSALLVIIIILIIFIRRKRSKSNNGTGEDTQRNRLNDEGDKVITDINLEYVSGDDVRRYHEDGARGNQDDDGGTNVDQKQGMREPLYTVVDKSKNDDKRSKGRETKGEAYENVGIFGDFKGDADAVGSNPTNGKKKRDRKNDLVYVDIDFSGRKATPVVHGRDEEPVEYAGIDYTKRGPTPPPPSDSDDEEDGGK